jgi:hypothetical protein
MMDMLLGETLRVSRHDVGDDPTTAEEAFFALAAKEGLSASAGEIAAARIDVSKLETADDVGAVIAAHIEHLADVARHIIDKAPHHLNNVEAAANELGYFHGQDGWQKRAAAVDDVAGADHEPIPEATARPTLGLKNKPTADLPQDGPVVTIKKHRGAALEPEAAWPFPISQ